jgi:acetylornithine deacetylase/succinyl-diaminopimelate desuccinylase family protein
MNPTAAVYQEIGRLTPAMVQVLSELVRVPSINPKYPGQSYDELAGEEGRANALVAELYQQAGAEVTRFSVEPGRDNAVGVVTGTAGGRSLALNGHIDVVPPGDQTRWQQCDPFAGRADDERVWGRGTTDMKAGIVAQAFAAIALRNAGVRLAGDLILQSVVGEEMGDHECGTTAVLERGYRADAAVVCEPTSMGAGPAVVPVAPGLLWFSVTVTGKQAHSGLRGLTVQPALDGLALGVNAVDKGFLVYRALRELEDQWAQTKRHPLFVSGQFGILPGVVQASPQGVLVPFSLADRMTIEYCAFHDPRDGSAQARDEIERCIDRAAAADPWLAVHPPSVEWKLEWPPTGIDEQSPICQRLSQAHEAAAHGTRFTGPAPVRGFMGVCDTTWLQAAGVPALVYGPGNGKTAHAADEHVLIEEMAQACRTYATLALDWCGAGR